MGARTKPSRPDGRGLSAGISVGGMSMNYIEWELEKFPQYFGKLRCSTVIDRQTLTHVICNMDSPEGVERDVFARVMNEVAKTLDKVPFCEIEQQSEWISVKDRLPETDGEYLIRKVHYWTDTDGYSKMGVSVYVQSHENPWKEVGNLCMVTHWMPLPEPPKEEDHEDH